MADAHMSTAEGVAGGSVEKLENLKSCFNK